MMRRSLLMSLFFLLPSLPALADEDAEREAALVEAELGRLPVPPGASLEKNIRPVSGHLFRRAGRHELSPWVGMSLADAFFTKYMVGLRYAWHPWEDWSIGIGGGVAHSSASGAITRCDSQGAGCRAPTKEELARTPGDVNYVLGMDVSWAPIYGKISVLAETVLHFDTYLLAGGGLIQTRIEPPGERALRDDWGPEAHLAIGQRYRLSRDATLRLELRETLFRQTVLGKNGPEPSLQSLLLFSVGVSFFMGGA